MKYLLSVSFLLMVVSTQAQQVEWGLKAGLQITQFKGDDFSGRQPTSSSNSLDRISTKGGNNAGYTIGGYIRTTENVFLQGELLVSVKGASLKNNNNGIVTAIQYGQLDIPLSLGFKYRRVELTGGPLISLQLFDDDKLKSFLSQFSASPLTFSPYRSYTFGYQAGAGVNFNKLSLGVRYLASIQPVSDMYISYAVPGDTQLKK
ncbi:MAG: outer membrane beta-barrel protein [Spirosomataceae bacterium]